MKLWADDWTTVELDVTSTYQTLDALISTQYPDAYAFLQDTKTTVSIVLIPAAQIQFTRANTAGNGPQHTTWGTDILVDPDITPDLEISTTLSLIKTLVKSVGASTTVKLILFLSK